jgi:hypothetical protein
MKFTTALFDYNTLSEEVRNELKMFFLHYNSTITELQQVLKSLTINDNFNGALSSQRINSGQATSISTQARYATIVSSTAKVLSYRITITQQGLIAEVDFEGSASSDCVFLLLNN